MESQDMCRVLVIDDEKLMRETLRPIFSGLGAQVVAEAENGDDGIRAFQEHRPDATFLDIKMPGKSGVETLKDIIEIDPDAVVVMLTAVTDSNIADSCIEHGARHFIRKGASPAILSIMLKAGLDMVNPAA